MSALETFDVVVVGGGPAGATAADDLARAGRDVLLLDRAGRIKPCGGAIPPRLVRDFAIPDSQLCARISSARMVSPSGAAVDMPINAGGYVGIVDREIFDEFLRARAAENGATRRSGTFTKITRDSDGVAIVHWTSEAGEQLVRARSVIGADGANSAVGRSAMPGARTAKFVFAYHEIVKAPEGATDAYSPTRCDIYYDGSMSPDFYSWVFPHGSTMSVGTGTANKGFSLKGAISELRRRTGLAECETIRREGAPIPLKPMKRWDNGRDVILVGDACGVVAPSSGRGHLLRDGLRPHGCGGGGDVARERRRAGTAHGAEALHEGARHRVPGARDHAVLLVFIRQAPREVRLDLPGQGRAGAHLAVLHEQGADALEADGPGAHLLQGSRAAAGDRRGSGSGTRGIGARSSLRAKRSNSGTLRSHSSIDPGLLRFARNEGRAS